MKIPELLNDKNILIWGYGREGRSTEKFINSHCNVASLEIFEGSQDEVDDGKYDLIIKSPGINVEYFAPNYTSQTGLFLMEFRDRTIGITGTKGKSTTSTMLYKALQAGTSKKVFLVGNLGYPCLDHYDEIDDNSIVVYEMSCHQLVNISISPHIGVFLNLYEDHLDYYHTMENYFSAKKNICAHMNEDDIYICSDEVPPVKTRAKTIIIPLKEERSFDMRLPGDHNRFNADVVYRISTKLFNCDEAAVLKEISDFNGLPHRLEHIGCIDGVDYYDDSISTIPEATIQAIKSIPNVKTVLIGGMDRNINYDILIDHIKKEQGINYIFSYASGLRIYNEVSGFDNCHYTDELEAAVALAESITPEGFACVLSPAAASYGHFKNFEERGDAFKRYVLNG